MTKIKNRKADIKIYIIPILIITLISVIIMFTIGRSIRNYFYDLKKEEALKIARGISTDLSHTAMAVDTINGLLDEKLIDFLNVADGHREYHSDEFFTELANRYELDEVYSYNSEGVIEYSSSGNYLGWKANEGHPVHDFMVGNEDMIIEDIRRDSESELYYKYGYIKNSDGSFIQVGILAEKVHDLLESFSLQNHLEDMIIDGDIVELSALDKDFRIIASTNNELIGSQISTEAITARIKNGKIFDHINDSNGLDLYEIFVPFEHETQKVIAFGIQYSLNDMLPVIRNNTLISISGIIIVYISLFYSIITTYKRNKKLTHLAYYDSLTELPNTESLKYKFDEDIIKNKENIAILMVKCDNLNLINLTFGYDYGDMVLKELGDRIKTIENNNIQLFKFTAEKFVFYIEDYEKREELLSIIDKVNELLKNPFIINNMRQHVAIKIGVMEYKDTTKSLDKLLMDATIALNYVDTSEGNNYSIFNETMELNVQRAETIERELRAAISEKDTSKIYLVYQPIIDSSTNKIDGFEALARMNSEQLEFVSPIEFIDIAEKKQLIIPLSNLILRKACTFIANVIEDGFTNIRISVNISTIHLLQEDFVTTVLNILEESGIDGRNLELEITETIFMDNFHIVNNNLKELRAKGIHISLDDFGTGYSSFDRLSELNVDTLKIDQYFINKITDNNKDSMITKDIISIAHRLGLKTIAEGVELDIQKDYLLEYNCDKFQGYLFSKPVLEEEAIKILNRLNN